MNSRRLMRTLAALIFSGASVDAQQTASSVGVRMVDVDGRAVRVQVQGLDKRASGSPVVVFESGAANGLDVWRGVVPLLSGITPVVAYDRAGLGQSAWDSVTPTPRHVAQRLRRILRQVGAEPPYLLVGWSWGGSLARYFAGYHPGEVAGIVYVDPGPIVTQSLAERLVPFEAVGPGRAAYDAFWSIFAGFSERGSAGVREEFKVFRGLMEVEPSQRDLRPVPDVPVAVIIAAKYMPLPVAFPFDARAQFEADVRHRIRMLQEWALASPRGTLVVSNTSTHLIPREDPELVAWAVKRVLVAVPARP